MTDSTNLTAFNNFEIKNDNAQPILQGKKIISRGDLKTRVVWNQEGNHYNFAAVKNKDELSVLDLKKNWVSITIDGTPLLGNINSISKRFGISKKAIRGMSPDQLETFLKATALPPKTNMNSPTTRKKTFLNEMATKLLGTKVTLSTHLEKNFQLYLTNLSSKSKLQPEANNFLSCLCGVGYADRLRNIFLNQIIKETPEDYYQVDVDGLALRNTLPSNPHRDYKKEAEHFAREALDLKAESTPPQLIVNLFLYNLLSQDGIEAPTPLYADEAVEMGILKSLEDQIESQVRPMEDRQKKTATFFSLIAEAHHNRTGRKGGYTRAQADRQHLSNQASDDVKRNFQIYLNSATEMASKYENKPVPSDSLVNIFLYLLIKPFGQSSIDPPEFYDLGKKLGVLEEINTSV